MEDMIQTLGRGTFNGKDVLRKNGFKYVTVLSTAQDLVCARKYHVLTEFIQRRMEEGDTLLEALSGKNTKIPDTANPFRHSDRKIGPGPKYRSPAGFIMKEKQLLKQDIFESPTECDDYLIQSLRAQGQGSAKLLEAVSRLWKQTSKPFTAKEIQAALRRYSGKFVRLSDASRTLNGFCDLGILERDKRGRDSTWAVKGVKMLECLLEEGTEKCSNPNHATPLAASMKGLALCGSDDDSPYSCDDSSDDEIHPDDVASNRLPPISAALGHSVDTPICLVGSDDFGSEKGGEEIQSYPYESLMPPIFYGLGRSAGQPICLLDDEDAEDANDDSEEEEIQPETAVSLMPRLSRGLGMNSEQPICLLDESSASTRSDRFGL